MICLRLTPWNWLSEFIHFILLLNHFEHWYSCCFSKIPRMAQLQDFELDVSSMLYAVPQAIHITSPLTSFSRSQWISLCSTHFKNFTFLLDTSNSLLVSNYFLLSRYPYLTYHNKYLFIYHVYCLPVSLKYKLQKRRFFLPFCALLYSQCIKQCLIHNRHLINVFK